MKVKELEQHIETLDSEINAGLADITSLQKSNLNKQTLTQCAKLLTDKVNRAKRLRQQLHKELKEAKEMETEYVPKTVAEQLNRLSPLLGRKVKVIHLREDSREFILIGLMCKDVFYDYLKTKRWVAILLVKYPDGYEKTDEITHLDWVVPAEKD